MILKIVAAVLALYCASAAPVRHQGPPIWVEIAIEESQVALTLSGEPEALRQLLGAELRFQEPATPAEREAVRSAFSEFIRGGELLAIDGNFPRGQLEELRLPPEQLVAGGWQVVQARFVVPLPARASRLSVRWSRFEGTDWNGEEVVPLTVLEDRRVAEQAALTPSEPEFQWDLHGIGESRLARNADELLLPVEIDRVRLPLFSLVLGSGALALLFWTRRRHNVRSFARVAAFGLFIAAALFRNQWSVPLPWLDQSSRAAPTSERALAIFEELHERIYEAFSASSETAIYELLESSVQASILDELYGEIYESLVLREHGGAVCTIEGIENGSGRVVFPEEAKTPLSFRVEWTWTLNGLVSHWGHLHRRRNEYEAVYEVVLDDGAWKIATVEVLQHRRVDLMDSSLELEGD